MLEIDRRWAVLRFAFALPVLAALLLTAAGCAGAPRGRTSSQGADIESLWQRYAQAVEAAKYPRPDRISKSLVPILTFTPGLIWDERREKVLMGTWTQAEHYTGQPPYEYTLPVNLWLTAVPFVRQFCRGTGLQGDALRLRIAERLGLPPNDSADVFVQMWVDPHDFYRPCLDPEISDQECQVNLTTGPVDPKAPCPWSTALADQLSGAFVTVSQSHLDWMCSNWASSYPPGEPRKSYPWTALGYTYDWGGKSIYGESEFVAPEKTKVVIQSITSTDVYCHP